MNMVALLRDRHIVNVVGMWFAEGCKHSIALEL